MSSTQSPTPSDGDPQITDEKSQDGKDEAVNNTTGRPFSVASEPMREDQVQNAVNFLSHPRVKGSPVIHRRSFLEKKGLTKEEIDEAFRRVPDPPSNDTSTEIATTNQAAIQTTSSTIQAPKSATAPNIVSVVPSPYQYRFRWSHALSGVAVLAASGAGTAVFIKKVVVPKLKTWIRKVVAEDNEHVQKAKPGSALAENAAEAAKAAATAAAIVSKANEELLNSKTEERKYFEAFMGMMDVQVKEMKTVGEAIRKLESSKGSSSHREQLVREYIQSTVGSGTTNNSWRTSQVGQPDASLSSMQANMNGTPNAEKKPSSVTVNAEPEAAPHPKSFIEIMEMVQRGEKPPNIRDIDDTPPNPNQPISKPLLAPRPKPWEVPRENSSYGSEDYGLTSSEPFWRRKAVNVMESEPKDQFGYNFNELREEVGNAVEV